jgi:hypothetical protein
MIITILRTPDMGGVSLPVGTVVSMVPALAVPLLMSGEAISTPTSTPTVQVPSTGGGAAEFDDLTDKATADLPGVNTPLANALALLAPRASPQFTGPVQTVGSLITVPTAMGGTVIDVTKLPNTKSIAVDTTFTFSAQPATAGTQFGLDITNTDSASHTITIPSSRSAAQNAVITAFALPAGATAFLTWKWDGTTYHLFGETGLGEVSAIVFTIDGGGSGISTGVKGDIVVPYACTIQDWTLIADQSGSIVLDVWKDTYANFPPTVADTITAAAKPTLSAASKAQNTTLTGWTKTVAAGDIFRINVDSASGVTRVTLAMKVVKA